MSSTFGENLKLTIFGQSHGAAIGMTLDGIPAGLPVELDKLQSFLNRRAPVKTIGPPPERRKTAQNFWQVSWMALPAALPSLRLFPTTTQSPKTIPIYTIFPVPDMLTIPRKSNTEDSRMWPAEDIFPVV